MYTRLEDLIINGKRNRRDTMCIFQILLSQKDTDDIFLAYFKNQLGS